MKGRFAQLYCMKVTFIANSGVLDG